MGLQNKGDANIFSRHQNLAALLVFFCLAIYGLGANPFAGQTVGPFDWLVEFPGWWTVQSDRDAVFRGQSDILNSQLPAWITLKKQIRNGAGALWYPNIAGGAPVSLELCNPAFLIFLAVKDNALAYYLAGLAKLVIAGFGAYLLVRIFVGWLPAVWGGAVFMLCGFNAAWFFWEQVTTAMWIPWLLWATAMYLKTGSSRWLPAITITSLLLIFGAFPPVGAFGFYSFALLLLTWNIYSYFSGKHKGFKELNGLKDLTLKTVLPLLAAGIAFIMAAVTLIPFMASISGVNLGWRVGVGTPFRLHDLTNFFSYSQPLRIETTAYLGIIACILAVLGILPLFVKQNRHLKLFVFFNIILVILSLLITFGLLPHKLISSLPVFRSNSWGRLIVIVLLGLSVLSALGLDFLAGKIRDLLTRYLKIAPGYAHWLVIVAVVLLFVWQFQSQKKLFNSFNAVAPSDWFYPLTPSIRYVQEHSGPLESVIADETFINSGTLGAYGIAEWYAHSFKTDREKEVLAQLVADPFASPTAATIKANKINYFSPLMDKLVIKYLLLNKRLIEHEKILDVPGTVIGLAQPLPGNSWRQHISMPGDMMIGYIGFVFATSNKEYAPANVHLTVYDSDGGVFAESELSRHRITSNDWSYFKFPEKVFFEKGDYSMALSLIDYNGPDSLTAMVTQDQVDLGRYLEVNNTRSGTSMKLRIATYDRINLAMFERKWNILDLESDIVVFENKDVTNGAYFIDNLDAANDILDFSGIDIEQPSSDLIRISYTKSNAGWIVLPMHLHSGWKAYVDDEPVQYDRFLDMMPAIPVNGGAGLVVFKYQPESFRKGLLASLTGFFIFLIFSGICFRRNKTRNMIP